MITTLTVATRGEGLTEITREVAAHLPAEDGLLTLFVRHTSCSLLIQENADPDVQVDLRTFLRRLIPPGDDAAMQWLTHVMEGPDDMPAHLRAAILPVNLSIPVQRGRMLLGRGQGVYLFEHRSRPHRREVALHFRPD